MEDSHYICPVCSKDSGFSLCCAGCIEALSVHQFRRLTAVWHQEVCRRDNYTCTYCGEQFIPEDSDDPLDHRKIWKICGDHIETKGSESSSRFDVQNGRTTCHSCHTKRHTGELSPHKTMAENQKEQVKRQGKMKKPPICEMAGCPIYALGKGKKPNRCFKHQ